MGMKQAASRAAGIAAVASLYIVYTCLHYVADHVRTANDGAEARGFADAGVLLLLVPPLLLVPLTGWSLTRQPGADPRAVGVARAATLTAVAVWVLSLAYLRFGPPVVLTPPF